MKNLFKYASLLLAAVMLSACGEENKEGGNEGVDDKEFYMVTDKDVIQSDGTDAATIRVFLGEEDVTALATIYDEDDNEINIDGGLFTATQDGEYKFWAAYGAYMTYDTKKDDNGLLTIRSISKAVPAVAEDPAPSNTSFVHRSFLIQYTGIQCGYCPYMIKIIKEMFADNTIPDKAVLAAVHSYQNGDPAYISAPAVNSYPYMHVNLTTGFTPDAGSAVLYSLVNSDVAADAAAGISVNPILYEEDQLLVVRVSVKAAEEGDYRVGAWLLEDNITGQQADYTGLKDDSFNTHENCVRRVDARYDGEWAGKPLGTIKAGKTVEKTFVMDLKLTGSKAWNLEELHLAVVVAKEGKGAYTACNAVDVTLDAPTPFQYK